MPLGRTSSGLGEAVNLSHRNPVILNFPVRQVKLGLMGEEKFMSP
jgi:hypothetical protein